MASRSEFQVQSGAMVLYTPPLSPKKEAEKFMETTLKRSMDLQHEEAKLFSQRKGTLRSSSVRLRQEKVLSSTDTRKWPPVLLKKALI